MTQLTMKEIQQQLEFAINRTPTSEKRNLICEANIALMRAIALDEQVDGGVPMVEREGVQISDLDFRTKSGE